MFEEGKFAMSITSVLVLAICVIATPMTIAAAAQMQPFMSANTISRSMVNGVAVTAINATDGNKITVKLNYTGNGTAPALTLVATAINIQSKDLNSLLSTFIKSLGSGIGGRATAGNASLTHSASKSIFQIPNTLIGSNIVNVGWKSPASVTVKLEGNSTTTTVHNANVTSVQVFPFTG
jgi:hypothetical protein